MTYRAHRPPAGERPRRCGNSGAALRRCPSLNIHFHLIVLDGVYVAGRQGGSRFVSVSAPTSAELQQLLARIVERAGRHLERRGLLERAEDQAWLSESGDARPLDRLLGASITYRIAAGSQGGEKAFMLRTLPAVEEEWAASERVARVSGFSRHAGGAARADQRRKVERLGR
ncbi:MAG: transposase [Pseudomonadota bacterium]